MISIKLLCFWFVIFNNHNNTIIIIIIIIIIIVDESNGIQHSMMRERLRREYFRRVRWFSGMSCMVGTRF